MSGETEASVSGWTVDTLRESLTRQIGDNRDALTGKIIDQRDYLRLQTQDLRDAMRQQILDQRESVRQQADDMRRMLDERYETQTKALDAAFKAAEQAVQTALVSAEKAVGKAEAAADKRFDAVNEFRQQLADQTATFPTRIEMNTRVDAVASDTQRNAQQIADIELRLTSRLDTAQGTVAGASGQRTERRLDTGQLITYALLVVAVLGLVLAYAVKK